MDYAMDSVEDFIGSVGDLMSHDHSASAIDVGAIGFVGIVKTGMVAVFSFLFIKKNK